MMFNQYIELIMIHALEKWKDGIEIGCTFYNNLRYADDASERFGLSFNTKKTLFMVIGRHTCSINIMYNGAPWNKLYSSFTLAQSSTRNELQSRRLRGE